MQDEIDVIEKIRKETEKLGLAENRALTQLLLDMHRQNREDIKAALDAAEKSRESAQEARKTKRVVFICSAVCALCATALALILGLTAGGMTISHESVTQDTHAAGTNNVYQDGENAQYIQEATAADGTASD